MPGMLSSADIAPLAAGDIVAAVLKAAINISDLYQLCTPVDVPNLTGTVPVRTAAGAVTEDLEELEGSDVEGATFASVLFNLKKDRVKFAVSDESEYKSRAGSPMDIQIQDAATQLAQILDKKVIKALLTTPQTGATAGVWSTATNNPMKDFAKAVAAIKPYKADFTIMPTEQWNEWMANDLYAKIIQSGNQQLMDGAVGKIPGLNLNIFVDTEGYQDANTVIVGASKACAAYGKGPVKVRTRDNDDLGAMVYTMDVYRQVVGPIYKNASNLNKAVYVLTGY